MTLRTHHGTTLTKMEFGMTNNGTVMLGTLGVRGTELTTTSSRTTLMKMNGQELMMKTGSGAMNVKARE